MEEESVASIEVTVRDVEPSSIQVNDQSKDDEKLTDQVFSVEEEELLSSHEKIKLLESENVLLRDQLSSALLRLDQMEQGEEKLVALQENLANILSEHQLLSGVKEAYDNLSLELHCSKAKIEELEQALQSALSNAAKFEELHIQTSLQADFQTRRAEELESLLQVAELSAKAANDQNSSLRDEIHALHQRILEKEESEALLISKTALEISAKEKRISQLEENLAEMESLLRVKVSEFEEIQMKLKEEVAMKEAVEASFRLKEEQVFILQEELAKIEAKRESLEANVVELTESFKKTIDRCSELETELKLSKEEFVKVDAVAAEALAMNSELEQKFMLLEQLHGEVVAAEASATQKNLELQDFLRSANAALEEARSETQQIEAKLEASEQRNIELQHQLALSETRYDDAERKLKEYILEVSELSMKLIDLNAEKEQMNREAQALRVQVSELELALSQSSALRSELEVELKIFNERCVEYESRLVAIHERNLEVEELVRELESLSETQKSRINDLAQEVETLQQKCQHAETKSKEDSEMVYALTTELEKSYLAKSTLENTLQLLETEKEQLICKVGESEIKIIELESTLSQALVLNSEFEAEVKELVSKHAKDESRVNATNERNLELEGLVRSFESTTEDFKRRVSELESLSEAQERRINDLEQEIETLVQKCRSVEMKEKESADIVSALTAELQSASICIEETRLKLQESEQKQEATEKQNMHLEDQLIFFKSKHEDDDRKIKELSAEVSQLSIKLVEMGTEKEQTDYRLLELRAKISELESALSQSLVLKSELDAELKIINERCVEYERRANAAHERNLELEDLIRSSNRRADDSDRRVIELDILLETQKEQTALQLLELRAKITEFESTLGQSLVLKSELEEELKIINARCTEYERRAIVAHERNLELEDLVRSLKSRAEDSDRRASDADRKLKEYNLEVSELSMKLIDLDAEKEQMNREAQALRVQVSELELALSQSSALRSELEVELKIFNERCVEYESRLVAIHERNLIVEELVRELESLSVTQKSRINDLEQEVETLQQKYQHAETKSKEDSEMVYALTTELEKSCLAKSTLENTLQLLQTEKEQLICKVEESEIKIIELESTLSQSLVLNSEFEAEIKELVNKHAEDESRVNATNERNLELEGLVRSLESTGEDFKRRVSELESLLEAQARRINDLEQEIETLVQKCRSVELKEKESADIVSALTAELQSASICIEETGLKLQESEQKLEATEKQNMVLEDQLIFFKSKHDDDFRKMKELSVEVSQLSMKLVEMGTEKEQTEYRLLELRSKISELETSLSQSLELKSELDAELKIINERCVEYERRANAAHERNLELEDLIRSSNQRAYDSDRRAIELDILLETQKEQTALQLLELRAKIAELETTLGQSLVLKSELEEELKIINARCTEHERRAIVAHERNLELEDLVRSLKSRAEDSDRRASDLEFCLETEKNRIKDLEQKIEILVHNFGLVEAESKENADMVSALTIELEKACLARSSIETSLNIITEEKLKLEEALHDSTCQILETEKSLDLLRSELHVTQEKSESVENNLKAAAIMEIELMTKLEASQVQLQEQGRLLEEATAKTIELESIKNDTDQELQILKQQIKAYEEELKQSSLKLISMESMKEELQQLLDLANDNKKDIARELTESKNTIVELIKQHARSCELHSETEARLLQAQMDLHATIQELTRKALEAKTYYEEQIQIHEVKANELSDIAEFRKIELEQYIVKVQDQENIIQALEDKFGQLEKHNRDLTEGNMKLEGELAEIQSKLDDLQQKLSLAVDERDSALENFQTSMKVTEDLQQELSCERQSFQSKIASIMEEKHLLSEANAVAQKELQSFITELQKQLNEYKECNGALEVELENLKLLVTQNSSLKSRVTELTEQLLVNESQFTKEIATIMEEKKLLNEENTMAQSELLTLATRFEEQLSEYKGSNEALKAKLENLNLIVTENCALQTKVKELEGLLLASEAQIAIMMEGKLILSEANAVAQNEVQTLITQLQEQLMVYKERNEALQSRVKELEEVLMTSEVEFNKEVENIEFVDASAARKIELITSKLEQHMPIVEDGNAGSENIQQLEGEVVSLPCARAELEDEKERKESKKDGKEKNIRVALGVALVSIVAAIVAGKN